MSFHQNRSQFFVGQDFEYGDVSHVPTIDKLSFFFSFFKDSEIRDLRVSEIEFVGCYFADNCFLIGRSFSTLTFINCFFEEPLVLETEQLGIVEEKIQSSSGDLSIVEYRKGELINRIEEKNISPTIKDIASGMIYPEEEIEKSILQFFRVHEERNLDCIPLLAGVFTFSPFETKKKIMKFILYRIDDYKKDELKLYDAFMCFLFYWVNDGLLFPNGENFIRNVSHDCGWQYPAFSRIFKESNNAESILNLPDGLNLIVYCSQYNPHLVLAHPDILEKIKELNQKSEQDSIQERSQKILINLGFDQELPES